MDKNANKIVYAIPFKEDSKKFLLTDSTGKEVILDINADDEGNGDVSLISERNKVVKTFEKAQMVKVDDFELINISSASTSSKNVEINREEWKLIQRAPSPFRECFDNAYNDVCDGFWGCVAWYTNVTVPIAAAVICSFQ